MYILGEGKKLTVSDLTMGGRGGGARFKSPFKSAIFLISKSIIFTQYYLLRGVYKTNF